MNNQEGNRTRKAIVSFLKKYKWWIIIPIIILIISYILIYLFFFVNGFIPVGSELNKSDWLAFFGSYISFAGTVIISSVAVLQNRYLAEKEKKRLEDERVKRIQPILSVNIVSTDSMIPGAPDFLKLEDPKTLPRHKNVTVEIENVGEFPIRHVVVYDKYMWEMLKPNEKKTIYLVYSDSPDARYTKDGIILLHESEYERTELGVPNDFLVNYEDIDGDEWEQGYERRNFDGKDYYSSLGRPERLIISPK